MDDQDAHIALGADEDADGFNYVEHEPYDDNNKSPDAADFLLLELMDNDIPTKHIQSNAANKIINNFKSIASPP